jgi:hypothetical protein
METRLRSISVPAQGSSMRNPPMDNGYGENSACLPFNLPRTANFPLSRLANRLMCPASR